MPDSSRHPVRTNLRYSSIDGMCYCIMMGLGEANIVVFALALGYGEVFAGQLVAAPLLAGALIHLVSPWCVARLGSHKRWLHYAAFVQSMAFIPMAVGAVLGMFPSWLLMTTAVVYWTAVFSAGSAWNTYIGVTTPKRLHARYFAFRSRILNVALVASTLLAGWVLHVAGAGSHVMWAFAGLFVGAALARLTSWYYTLRQTEPTPIPAGFRRVSWRELALRYQHGPGGRMIAFALAANLALQVSTPYVNPYLLEQIGLKSNYAAFGVLTASVLLAKVVALPMWGSLAHARGPHALLRVGGVIIIPLPLLWLVSDHFAWLLVVQLLTGAALAAYELAVFLMILRSIPDAERTSVMTKYQVVSQSATLLGSWIGAALLDGLGRGSGAYAAVFGASAAVRLLAVPLLLRVLPVAPRAGDERAARLDVHVAGAAADEPVLATMPAPASKDSDHAAR